MRGYYGLLVVAVASILGMGMVFLVDYDKTGGAIALIMLGATAIFLSTLAAHERQDIARYRSR